MTVIQPLPPPRPPGRVATAAQWILFITLLGSIIYVVVQLVTATGTPDETGERSRSDYVLMLAQCAGGLIVMFLPALATRRFQVSVPSGMQISYFVFLYAAIYLGEVRSFYYRIPYWDSLLHFFSGAMLGVLGFHLVRVLNDAEKRRIILGPGFVAFFAFCFAVTCGAVWEIYEYALDGLLGTNMQKVVTATGEVMVGRDALHDTMTDLILDATSALAVTLVGYLGLRRTLWKEAHAALPEQTPDASQSAPAPAAQSAEDRTVDQLG